MVENHDYLSFLRKKIRLAQFAGFEIDDSEINPILKPHQRRIVQWAVHGGNRAIFASFGLGKSVMQVEVTRLVQKRAGGKVLIVCPLGVRQEFKRDGAMLGVHLIERYSNKGEVVYDPFGGLMTVPYRAVLKGRRGQASELNTGYFFDGVQYLKSAEREFSMPSLFDFEVEQEAA